MSAVPFVADVADDPSVARVTVETVRYGRGQGYSTFTGTDRAKVLEEALIYRNGLDTWLRDPSYPSTSPTADGKWVATVSFWSAE